MTQLDDEERWEQWRAWFDFAVGDLQVLAFHRRIWKDILEMLNSNPEIVHSRVVNDWLGYQYRAAMAVGIRRQAQHHGGKRRPTLAAVLQEMVDHPGIATRERFLVSASDPRLAERVWTGFGGDSGSLPAAPIKMELDHLDEIVQPCREWLDSAVTHLDRGVLEERPSFPISEVNPALDELFRLARKYYSFFHPGITIVMTPEPPLGWTRMFEVPWKAENFVPVSPENLG